MKSLSIFILFLAFQASAFSQKIENSPDQRFRTMTSEQIDRTMQDMAAAVSQSAPIQTDEWTTILGAVYLKPIRTLNYRVSLSQSRSAQAVAQTMKPNFCAGRTNLALMDKGVSYQYSVTTPRDTYNITFTRADCQ